MKKNLGNFKDFLLDLVLQDKSSRWSEPFGRDLTRSLIIFLLFTSTIHASAVYDHHFEVSTSPSKGFSPKKGKTYKLQTKPIQIKQLSQKELLDTKNSLPDSAFDWRAALPFVNGLLLFLAGFLVAKFNLLKKWQKKTPRENPMYLKIKETKDARSLLKLLLNSKDNKYQKEIKALEEILYHGKKESLKEIKETLLTR